MVGRLVLVSLALAVALVGCTRPAAKQWWGRSAPTPPGEPSAASASPADVSVVRPRPKSLRRSVGQPGAVHAYEETLLFARVSGYVGKVHLDIGQKVRGPRYSSDGKEIEPGQILAEVDVPEMVEELNHKKALVSQAEADIEQAEKALAAAEAHIATT
jgi:multidrug resistance efflux pump